MNRKIPSGMSVNFDSNSFRDPMVSLLDSISESAIGQSIASLSSRAALLANFLSLGFGFGFETYSGKPGQYLGNASFLSLTRFAIALFSTLFSSSGIKSVKSLVSK